MIDIKLIREKPEYVKQKLKDRGFNDLDIIDDILILDLAKRITQQYLDLLRQEQKLLEKDFYETTNNKTTMG